MAPRSILFALLALVLGLALYWVFRVSDPGAPEGPETTTPRTELASERAPTDSTPLSEPAEEAQAPKRAEAARVPEQAASDALENARAALEEPATDAPRIQGRVVDRLGNPIEGAEIQFGRRGFPGFEVDLPEELATRLGRGVETESGPDGKFEVRGPRPGLTSISVLASGYAPYGKSDLAIPAGEVFDLGEIQLSLGAILSGHVVDPRGRGIAGAEIFDVGARDGFFIVSSSRSKPLAVTDENGAFRIDKLACGPWRLTVNAEEHPSRRFEGMAEVPGREMAGLRFELRDGTTIEGKVVGIPEDGPEKLIVLARAAPEGDVDPMYDFDFSPLVRREGVVGADGFFRIQGLEQGMQYALQVRDKGSSPFDFFGGSSRSERIVAVAGERSVELRYQTESAITFQVIDAKTKQPVTELEVSAGVRWAQALRGEDGKILREHPEGRVRVGDLYPQRDSDEVELEIRAVGYEDYDRDDIRLVRGGEVDLGVIALEPVPLVEVTVRDASTGAPIAGAEVRLEGPRSPQNDFGGMVALEEEVVLGDGRRGSRRAETDENGVARVSSLEQEGCVLHVESDDFAPFKLEDLSLPAGQVVRRVVELHRGGTVTVRVLDPDGVPMPGARVQHREPDAEDRTFFWDGPGERRRVTNTAGELVFEHLQPGSHRFRLHRQSRSSGVIDEGGAMAFINIAGAGGDEEAEAGWQRVEVKEGGEHELTIQAEPRTFLEGKVSEAGLPLAGASVSLAKAKEDTEEGMVHLGGLFGGTRAKTDGEGFYRFDEIEAGDYVLTITHPSRAMPAEQAVTVGEAGRRMDVDLPVTIIEGRVTDLEGNPLPGVRVRAERSSPGRTMHATARFVMATSTGDEENVVQIGAGAGGAQTRTDEDGRYSLRGVVAEVEVVVKADGEGVQPASTDALVLDPGEVRRRVDMELQPAGSVSVAIYRPDGRPASFCMITASYKGEVEEEEERPEPQNSFAQEGKGKLEGLRPGPWAVKVRPVGPGGEQEPKEEVVEVEAGKTVEKRFDLD